MRRGVVVLEDREAFGFGLFGIPVRIEYHRPVSLIHNNFTTLSIISCYTAAVMVPGASTNAERPIFSQKIMAGEFTGFKPHRESVGHFEASPRIEIN